MQSASMNLVNLPSTNFQPQISFTNFIHKFTFFINNSNFHLNSDHHIHPCSLFLQHALLLPSFLFLSSNIRQTISHFSLSSPIDFFSFHTSQLALPKLWVFLFVNVLSCYCCSKSVFLLNGLCTSLTITLLITLRKFFSLILSIQIFKNVFTLQHWLGTVLVFGGTLIFAEINLLNLWPFKRKQQPDENQKVS